MPVKPAPEVIQQSQFDAIKSCVVTLNSTINIRDAQQADPSISRLFNLKVNNKPKPSARQFRNEPYFRKMLRHYDRLFIHDEILVRAVGKSRLQY